MLTLNQILLFLAAGACLLTGYGYAKHKGHTGAVRILSSVLPLAFLLLAAFFGINSFDMISDGRISIVSRAGYAARVYRSNNLYFWFLAAMQIGATIFFLAVALKAWQRRHEA